MRLRQLTLLALASLLGCDDPRSFKPPICTAQFVYGISLDVVDSGSGAPLADSATMTLRDGNYVESASRYSARTTETWRAPTTSSFLSR